MAQFLACNKFLREKLASGDGLNFEWELRGLAFHADEHAGGASLAALGGEQDLGAAFLQIPAGCWRAGLPPVGDEDLGEILMAAAVAAVQAEVREGFFRRGWDNFVFSDEPPISDPSAQAGLEKFDAGQGKTGAEAVEFCVDSAEWEHAVDDVLESGAAHVAVVNDRVVHHSDGAASVDEAVPFRSAKFRESLGVLGDEQALGTAVAKLLAKESDERAAPPVPDEGAGREAKAEPGVTQPPAEINIVASGLELRVKSADCVEGGAGDDEIAAGEMLGLLVAEHDVARCAGSGADHGFLPIFRFGSEVWSTRSGELTVLENSPHAQQPLAVWLAIVIREGEDLAGGGRRAGIARGAQTFTRATEKAHPREVFCNMRRRAIGGSIIHDERLKVAAFELADRLQAAADTGFSIARADDHRNWRAERRVGNWHAGESAECGFGRVLAIQEAEIPVRDGFAIVPPAVAPCVE